MQGMGDILSRKYSFKMSHFNSSVFVKSHMIAGFGNPLLDISATLKNKTVLQKYNLKPDGQYEVGKEEFSNILLSLESENFKVTSSPGGCVQNTLRIVQALVKHPSFCVYFGGLGDDEEGQFLESEVKKCGLDTRYTKHFDYPTGRVAALINDDNRALVANLGAAEIYSKTDFMTPENLSIMEEVLIVYIEGFFITHSFDVALEIVNICKSLGVVFVFNISGAYVANTCPGKLLVMTNAADIVIGNVDEFRALANIVTLKYTTVEEMALNIHSSLWETNSSVNYKLHQMNSFGKTVVITQGKEPIFCVTGDKKLLKVEVPYLAAELVKDATGAGDAFVAGFLVALLENKSTMECLNYGCAIAQQIIQHIGIKLPSI